MKLNFKSKKGFSMIELIVSVGLITLIASISMPALVFAMKVNTQNRIKSTANTLAKDIIEKINGTPYDKIGNVNSSPEGIFQENTIRTIDGIDYKINTKITWEKRGSDTKAFKNIKVIVRAQDTFTKAEKVVCEMYNSVSEGVKEAERTGKIKIIVKDTNNTRDLHDIFQLDIKGSEKRIVSSSPYYNYEHTYDNLPIGSYRIQCIVPRGYFSPEVRDSGNSNFTIEKYVTVDSGSEEKVFFYIDNKDNSVTCTLQFDLQYGAHFRGIEGGKLTLYWEIDGIRRELISNANILDKDEDNDGYVLVYTINNLWPSGTYMIKIVDIPGFQDLISDEIVNPNEDFGGLVYVWPK